MSERQPFKRGEVLLAALPFVTDPSQAKVRPVVVIQNDVGNRFSPNLIVAGISSRLPPREFPTDLIVRAGSEANEGSGLDRDSVVQGSYIITIPKAMVVRHLGQFSEAAMQAIDQRLKVSLRL
jgi:mRNA interferase MazF